MSQPSLERYEFFQVLIVKTKQPFDDFDNFSSYEEKDISQDSARPAEGLKGSISLQFKTVLFCWGRQKREGFVFLRVTEQEILKETYTKPHIVTFFKIN